jgi:hypothetical protein
MRNHERFSWLFLTCLVVTAQDSKKAGRRGRKRPTRPSSCHVQQLLVQEQLDGDRVRSDSGRFSHSLHPSSFGHSFYM